MEGLGQLVFILILVAAAAIDAMARRGKKQRRMEEMEREEERATTGTRDRPDRQEAPRERGRQEGARAEQERETADAMIPEDFWAILTGEAPAEAPPGEGRRQEEPSRQPHIPMPVPGDRYSETREREEREAREREEREAREREEREAREREERARAEQAEQPAPTRRGGRWMDGLGRRGAEELEEEAIRAQEAEVYEAPPEPWGAIDDIAAGEIGEEDEGLTGAIGEERDARPRRRTARTSTYTRLLETGDREDLRKAVVLREVLGSPAGFREIGHDWDAER
jgi:hypothetical protein